MIWMCYSLIEMRYNLHHRHYPTGQGRQSTAVICLFLQQGHITFRLSTNQVFILHYFISIISGNNWRKRSWKSENWEDLQRAAVVYPLLATGLNWYREKKRMAAEIKWLSSEVGFIVIGCRFQGALPGKANDKRGDEFLRHQEETL